MQKAYMDTKWAQIDAKCEGSKEKKEITAKKKEVISNKSNKAYDSRGIQNENSNSKRLLKETATTNSHKSYWCFAPAHLNEWLWPERFSKFVILKSSCFRQSREPTSQTACMVVRCACTLTENAFTRWMGLLYLQRLRSPVLSLIVFSWLGKQMAVNTTPQWRQSSPSCGSPGLIN